MKISDHIRFIDKTFFSITVLCTFGLGFLSCGNSLSMGAIFKGDASLKFSSQLVEVTEGSGNGSFAVTLASRPTADVSVGFKLSVDGQAILFPEQVTFKASNYDIPQIINIMPLSDCVNDGDQNLTVDIREVISGDKAYRSAENPQLLEKINLIVKDNPGGQPAILFLANEPVLKTAEDGGNDKFLVALSCQPNQPVTINLSSNNLAEGTIDQNTIVLDSNNFATGKLITLTGQSDCTEEPDIGYIISASSNSNDGDFDGLNAAIGAVNKNISLQPGLQILQSNQQVNRGTGSYNFFQVRMSCAPPVEPMTISVAVNAGPPTVTLLSPNPNSHSFNSSNWNIPIDVISRIDSDEGNPYSITISSSNQAGSYPAQTVNIGDSPAKRVDINVTGLGASETITIKNGLDSIGFSTNGSFKWFAYTGENYQFELINPPAGKVCSIAEKQFGIATVALTLNLQCIQGQMVGGRFQVLPPNPLQIMLYQGGVSDLNVSGLSFPNSLVFNNGFLYFGDYTDCDGVTPGNQYCVYKVSLTGVKTIFVTNLPFPIRGITTHGDNLYFSAETGGKIYKANLTTANVSLIYDSGSGNIYSLASDDQYLYYTDRIQNGIRRLNPATGTSTVILASGYPAISGIAVVGNELYFTDLNKHAIFKIAKTGGSVTTMFGSETISGFQDGSAANARFNQPHDLVYDGSYNLFLADYSNFRIRRIDLQKNRVTTIAGNGDNATNTPGIGAAARLRNPVGITTDGRSLYVNTHSGHKTWKIADNALIGYWPLNQNTIDYASDTNTVPNATWSGTEGYNNGRFDETKGSAALNGPTSGNTHYLTTKDIPFTTGSFTMSAWVKVADINRGHAIFGNIPSGINYEPFFYLGTNGSVNFINWSGAATKYTAGSLPHSFEANQWVHVAYVYNAIDITRFPGGRVFVNGHDRTIGSNVQDINAPSNIALPLRIGYGGGSGSSGGLSGQIAEARIYARALSEAEVHELAQDAKAEEVGASFSNGPTQLLSHYTLQGPNVPQVLADFGSANQLLTVGSSYIASNGKDNETSGSANFDGSNNYLHVTTAKLMPLDNAPRSLCAWVNPSSLSASNNNVAVSFGGTGSSGGFGLGALQTTGQLAAFYGSAGDFQASVTLPLNTWSHICHTHSGSQAKLYFNGNMVASRNHTLSTVAGNLAIGAWIDYNSKFAGKIDEVRIYNDELTDKQIRQLAVQIPNGLVLHFDTNGDDDEISGFQHSVISNNGSQVIGRQGLSNTAYRFLTNQKITIAHNDTLMQSNNISWAFWFKSPDLANLSGALFYKYDSNAPFSGWVMKYDQSNFAHGWTVGTTSGNGAYSKTTAFSGNNIWKHLAYVKSGSNLFIYLDGVLVSGAQTGNGQDIKPNTENILIGMAQGSGEIITQDMRIYGRALTLTEIQAMIPVASRRIFVSSGGLPGNHFSSVGGGDSLCNNSLQKPSGGGSYKAMLVQSGVRQACSTAFCAGGGSSENIDWVFLPNTNYYNVNGQLVGTTNSSALMPTNLLNTVHTNSKYWTGLNNDWTVGGTCNGWTNGTSSYSSICGQGNSLTAASLISGWSTLTCDIGNGQQLLCVEQ